MNEIAQYFDELAISWDDAPHRASPVQPAVALIGGATPGARVLDLGCGTGIMADVYLQLGVEQVVGLDLSPRMITIAQEKFANEPRVHFLCCDVLDYEDVELFDSVVIYNAYPHFREEEALVRHVCKLLKPQGRFVVAHGMGRAAMNAHHANVPASVTSELLSAAVESQVWERDFIIDTLVDTPAFYCFAGAKRG